MGYNPSAHKGYSFPVETVSWCEAVQYALKLTLETNDVNKTIREEIARYNVAVGSSNNNYFSYTQDNMQKCVDYANVAGQYPGCYRLPTEVEWEAALRGGANPPTTYIWGNTWNDADASKYAVWNTGATVEVGSRDPFNGLYDMLGNVWEWCSSVYSGSDTSYNSNRVMRGGAYNVDYYYGHNYFQSACRYYNAPSGRNSFLGFRLARTV